MKIKLVSINLILILLLYLISGAQEARYIFFAPAFLIIDTIYFEVFPLTIESSTNNTFLFFIFQIFLSSLLSPVLQDKARSFLKTSNMDFFPSLMQEKKFIDTVDKLTIFIENKSSAEEFENIFLRF